VEHGNRHGGTRSETLTRTIRARKKSQREVRARGGFSSRISSITRPNTAGSSHARLSAAAQDSGDTDLFPILLDIPA
jgi:hypothetical protein